MGVSNRVLVRAKYRTRLYLAQNNTCYLCEKKMRHPNGDRRNRNPPHNKATVDHVFPRSRGGYGMIGNVLLACSSCNHEKGDRMPTPEELAYLLHINRLMRIDPIHIVDPDILEGMTAYLEMELDLGSFPIT